METIQIDLPALLQMRTARAFHLYAALAVGFFGYFASLTLILAYADGAPLMAKLALASLVVASTCVCAIGGQTAAAELAAISKDAAPLLENSRIGKQLATTRVGEFGTLTLVLGSVIGCLELTALFYR
jgi:hypothetical protein